VAGESPFGTLSVDEFLRDHWQKKPLLVRGAFPDLNDPVSPEDLAGLAVEAPVESRLVLTEHEGVPFAVHYGPLEPGDFENLPESDWTLLVRHVDKLVPEMGALLEHFRFMPDWRIDDIMVSYAVPGGSVGPHVDGYDVFLIQGMGRRRWQINTGPDAPATRREDTDLDVLAEFTPTEEWELEPGDMLYLPPGVAHHGIALEPGLTYSVGFRAPAQDELLAGWLEHLMKRATGRERYRDPDLKAAEHPGKIGRETLDQVRKLLTEALDFDETDFREWFGRFITEDAGLPAPEPEPGRLGLERLKRQLDAGKRLVRNPLSRVCYMENGDRAWLFVSGACYRTTLSLASRLGDQHTLGYQELRDTLKEPDDSSVVLELLNQGHWRLED